MDWRYNLSRRMILDNGSHEMRFGDCDNIDPKIVQLNLLAQLRKTGQLLYGSEQLNQLVDESTIIQHIKPIVRGVLVNFDKEIILWEHMMGKECGGNSITLTHHPFQPEQVHSRTSEVLFEYFGYDAYMPLLSQKALRTYAIEEMQISKQFSLVIESGHSATYIVPIFDSEPVDGGIKRLEIGGKLLTNYLKEAISLKSFEFKNFYLLANQIKEEIFQVSLDYRKDIKIRQSVQQYFILPDYDIGQKGYSVNHIDVGSSAPKINFNKECIRIPESIFTPNDIGLDQIGLIHCIQESLNLINDDLRGYLLENIILSGGNTKIKNFKQRFEKELRENTDQKFDINVHQCQPNATYRGAYYESIQENFPQSVITKNEYNERGFNNLYPIFY